MYKTVKINYHVLATISIFGQSYDRLYVMFVTSFILFRSILHEKTRNTTFVK